MNLGFNSDVRLGDTTYHVQTEDRGAAHPFIDTLVYLGGRVVHRRTSGYQDLLSSGAAGEAPLQHRVEQQHRRVIEELRAGGIPLDFTEAPPPPAGIQVQLLNPASWLAAGTARLQVEVCARGGRQPQAGAHVEVLLQGAQGPVRLTAQTDSRGCAELSFPLPELGPGGAALRIRAAGASGEDEIRYQLRPKARTAEPSGRLR